MLEIGTRIHLIGIGGSGLSAIARVLNQRGLRVSGSDRTWSPVVQQLSEEGIQVYIGHQPQNVHDAQLIIRSSAIAEDNPEVQAAQAAGIPIFKRVEFLPFLIGEQKTIAIAGTHGKTTTTAMTAWVLSQLGLDPSFVIGGVSIDLQTNAQAGQGSYFVIEADEYDGMFLGLHPQYAILTNIEYDHPDCYPTPHQFQAAFEQFVSQIQPDGCLIACVEDEGVRRLLSRRQAKPPSIGYALQNSPNAALADYLASQVGINHHGAYSFKAVWQGEALAQVELQIPGLHNVRNALAVVALCHQIGLPLQEAAQALSAFHGSARRFQIRGTLQGVTLVDDYAHHPSEIKATLSAARDRFPDQFLWAVWQPHTYSRTLRLWEGFRQAFADADAVIVLDVYGAREKAPPGFSMAKLATEIQSERHFFIPRLEAAAQFLVENLAPNQVVLILSAGDADQLSHRLLNELEQSQEKGL
ncbi:MAG: UDP-N-acetylmuramate--L-alanine ligase [Anaerolineae bacterium]|jgi:UDP-N-acetylmuramate--alanine ligase|nr:MAG: UDP-N-acetylmuramate--L-alanine ligase [Anaerolineae bacterium]